MIIDDDVSLLGFTSKYLTRLGHSVTTFRSGEAAWKEFGAAGADYALVLIDLFLAGLSGKKVSEMILNASLDVRLILMSGYPIDPIELLEADPDRTAFLQKPFTPAMLTEAVDRFTRPYPKRDAN